MDILSWILFPKFQVVLCKTQQWEHNMFNEIGNMSLQQIPSEFRLDAIVSQIMSWIYQSSKKSTMR